MLLASADVIRIDNIWTFPSSGQRRFGKWVYVNKIHFISESFINFLFFETVDGPCSLMISCGHHSVILDRKL